MPDTITLSESAVGLLHRRLSGERVEVSETTHDAYRELTLAGYAEPVHTPRGRDAHYRLTWAAMALNDANRVPSP